MRKYCFAYLVFLLLLEFLTAEFAYSNYQLSIIASGDNRPDFSFTADLKNLVISIHNHVRPEEYKKNHGWSDAKYDQSISFLLNKGFLEKKEKEVNISCMVINDQDGKRLYEYAEPISQAIADSIIGIREKVREAYSGTRLAENYSFDSMTFFLLSDVLLDNWQIHNVENKFLNAQRPLRHGKNYYLAFLEGTSFGREPFGIYGNQVNKTYSVYGNNRGNIEQEEIKQKIASFPILGLDEKKIKVIAETYTPVLLDILEANRNYANDVFKKTGYADAIKFEEFFIWWYHFIYSRSTEILAKKGALTIPESGNFFYRYWN